MRHGDNSFPAIYVMVVLAHVGAIAWVLLGARGCQQSLVASTPAKDSATEKSALRLNLALPQSTAESLPPANEYSPSDDGGGMQTRADSAGEDPASRLTFPASNRPDAKAMPEPAPPAVREVPREKLDLVEREKQAREEAEAQARQRDALRQAEEARKEQARKEQEIAAREEERKLALKQQADRNAAAQTERQLAEREAELERKTEEIARLEETERKLAQEREAERKAAESLRQRKLVEQRERERRQQVAANKKKEEERKFALQEAERKAAAEAAERQRQLAEQRGEERRAAEAAERQRQLAEQREEERRAAEAAERQRQFAEQREREEAKRVEKARVVPGAGPVTPAVVKPNVVGTGEGGNGSWPEVVAAKPRGGGSADAGVLDMGAYRATVQKMIKNRWTIPAGIEVESYPEVLVRINRAGKVVFARNERNSGVPELDRSAINAVRIGSELIPLPPGYDKDVYEVTVKFQVE